MAARPKPHATGKTKPGDIGERVGVVELEKRGVNVKELVEKLIDAAGPSSPPSIITRSCVCTSLVTKITRRSVRTLAWKTVPISS